LQTAAPAEVDRNIAIDRVEIANPVVIAGRSRTFENNVALRVRDAKGTVIAEDFVTSEGEMAQHNPFRGTVWITRDPGERVMVEALEFSAKDGSEQSLVQINRPYDVERIEAKLFFPNPDCTALVPFTRRLPKSVSMARLLAEALIDGPIDGEDGAVSAFPRGSGVRSVNLREGLLTIDFNERLQNVGGSCAALMIRESVTNTLQQLPAVKKVVITAGGSEALALQP
jgi:hypothetical protein